MRRMHLLTSLLALGNFLAGCASTAGLDYPSGNISKLHLRETTKNQVDQLFGKPYRERVLTSSQLESVFYYYGFAKVSPYASRYPKKFLNIEFVDNLVNGYQSASSFDEEATDFSAELRDQIVVNRSTNKDVVALLGQPSGMFGLPSNLLSELHEQYRGSPPAGSTECWIYQYEYNFKKGSSWVSYFKFLLLYFDSDGVVLDKIYSESSKE